MNCQTICSDPCVTFFASPFLGFLFSILWTVMLYRLKPKLCIKSCELENGILKIGVKNKGYYNAINLKFEVCTINNKNQTYHFESDRDEFLILPGCKKCSNDTVRHFKIREISESARYYVKDFNTMIEWLVNPTNNMKIRVRFHASHEYSGFGKSFEQYYVYSNGRFIKTTND